jgi:hydroxymethylglutaryl-CoA reductase
MNKTMVDFQNYQRRKIKWTATEYFSILKQCGNKIIGTTLKFNNFMMSSSKHDYKFLHPRITPNFDKRQVPHTHSMAIEEMLCHGSIQSCKILGYTGGFKTTVINTEKRGQVHFIFKVMYQTKLLRTK